MQNFTLLSSAAIRLPAGVFVGVKSYACYASGELEGLRLSERNTLCTRAGTLIPAYTETHRRKNKYSVEFYRNGAIKAVALNEPQEIKTPIGALPAELATFFETGELKRVLPLDGKIDGMWSEEEEKALAIPLSFEFPFAAFTAAISGLSFYRSGVVRSVTLFPGEIVPVETTCGKIRVRNGFSLYASGKPESIEPAEPVVVRTPIGALAAFDPNAVGVCADSNSLAFDESGRVIALTAARHRVAARTADGRVLHFSPRALVNPLDGESMITEGLKIAFDYGAGTVSFLDRKGKTALPLSDCGFTVAAYRGAARACGPSDCAGCALACGA
jgi:hypothetical protein